MDAWRMTKWSILNERLRNPDPAVLVSHAVDIYLLKNPTANAQPLDLLVTIDGERTASGEKSLLTRAPERSARLTAATPGKWAGQTARCRPRGWCTSPARPDQVNHGLPELPVTATERCCFRGALSSGWRAASGTAPHSSGGIACPVLEGKSLSGHL